MALGKGLGAILEEIGEAYERDLVSEIDRDSNSYKNEVLELLVDAIDPNPYQPREDFDLERLEELGESIKKHGLLQPIIVIPNGDRWLLVAGERRLRAHKLMGLDKIRAVVADVSLDNLRMRELALVENIQRENLNPIELAKAYQELLIVHKITHESLAKILHKSRSQITNTIRLLSLSNYAQNMLLEQKITQGHAKVLLGLSKEKQQLIIDKIIKDNLSVRETEAIAKRQKSKKDTKEPKEEFFTQEAHKRLRELLPFDFRVKRRALEIRFNSEEELQNFIDFLNKREK